MLRKTCFGLVFMILTATACLPIAATPSQADECVSGDVSELGGTVGATGSSCGDDEDDDDDGGGGGEPPEFAEYRRMYAEWVKCLRIENEVSISNPSSNMSCGAPPEAPPGFPGDPFARMISNLEIAEMATARLNLPAPDIAIGPDPAINPWKSAIIGVNYWIYTKGPASLPTTGETVGGVSAHLSARITGLVVNTNANQSNAPVVRCAGPGTPWPRGTHPNQPSPTCGHIYTKPASVAIQVTAIWTVSWEVNGETGTITVGRTSTLDVEVKELHSVNR